MPCRSQGSALRSPRASGQARDAVTLRLVGKRDLHPLKTSGRGTEGGRLLLDRAPACVGPKRTDAKGSPSASGHVVTAVSQLQNRGCGSCRLFFLRKELTDCTRFKQQHILGSVRGVSEEVRGYRVGGRSQRHL